MTTASELVTQALREGNLIPVGVSATADELAEGLNRLNAFINSLFGTELGEHLQDWEVPSPLRTAPVSANYPQLPFPPDTLGYASVPSLGSDRWPYPPANSRLVVGITDATTVYLPQVPADGARMAFAAIDAMTATLTLDANGRAIEGAATHAVTSADSGQWWFYRADTANWQLMSTLVAGDQSPFPVDLDDLLVCGLSIRMSPRYGQEPRAGTVAQYKNMIRLAVTRYKQRGTTVSKSYETPNTYQSHRPFGWMG